MAEMRLQDFPADDAMTLPALISRESSVTLAAQAPSRTELVRRATELIPLLRKHAAWAEENRRLHDEVIEALAAAGIVKMRAPIRYGGYESDARAMLEVATELGQGDGSTSWTASVWWITTWMIGLFSDETQDEVFSTPGVRVCGTLSPTGVAGPARGGGIVVNGKWGFMTGALSSHWQLIVAVLVTPDGPAEPIMAAVPMSDLEIIDDWHTAGMRGTGSVSTVATDVFVPEERVLSLGAMLHEQYGSKQNAEAPVFRGPMLPTIAASSVGTMLGLGRAAREDFFSRLPGRHITYTSYSAQAEAPVTHLQVADACLKIDAAEFHALRLADLVDAKNAGGEDWDMRERAQARVDAGRACQLVQEAVDVLRRASGGSSLYTSAPIQRIERDVQAVNLHALMHPDTNLELYGRVLCGLEPNTIYI
jgi:alkylation response protein AidB-like acyl-CoA dehydrogenase